jgi:hypothetical protein
MTDTRRQEIERLLTNYDKACAAPDAGTNITETGIPATRAALWAAIDALLKDAVQLRKCIAEARSRLRPVDCMPCELASYKLDAAIDAALSPAEGSERNG